MAAIAQTISIIENQPFLEKTSRISPLLMPLITNIARIIAIKPHTGVHLQ